MHKHIAGRAMLRVRALPRQLAHALVHYLILFGPLVCSVSVNAETDAEPELPESLRFEDFAAVDFSTEDVSPGGASVIDGVSTSSSFCSDMGVAAEPELCEWCVSFAQARSFRPLPPTSFTDTCENREDQINMGCDCTAVFRLF